MSAGEKRTAASLWAETERRVHDIFEPQLRDLDLGVEQIGRQNLAQLGASLDTLNDAIANADSFGKIRLLFTAEGGAVIAKSESEAQIEIGILPILLKRKALVVDRIKRGAEPSSATSQSSSIQDRFAIMRLNIDGSWSVEDIVKLLTQLEQAYLATAALESLGEPSRMGILTSATSAREFTPDELMQAAVAFRLGGGLRIEKIHYNSPGLVEVIGAANPLKTVKDGVTEYRDNNRRREKARLSDERERQRQSMEHELAMEQERHRSEEMRLAHEREVAKLHIEAEVSRVQSLLSVIDRLSPAQRTPAAASLFQLMTRNVEGIANEARVGQINILDGNEPAALQVGGSEDRTD